MGTPRIWVRTLAMLGVSTLALLAGAGAANAATFTVNDTTDARTFHLCVAAKAGQRLRSRYLTRA